MSWLFGRVFCGPETRVSCVNSTPFAVRGPGRCLKAQDSDGDLFPEGYGITEVAGLNWELDTAVYTHGALVALAEMATVLEDQETATEAAELAARLAEAIEERYWLEEQGLYADLIAPPKVVLERLEQIRSQENYQSAAMRSLLDEIEDRCRRSDPEAEQPWLFKTWVIFCPLETGLASEERALRALRALGKLRVYRALRRLPLRIQPNPRDDDLDRSCGGCRGPLSPDGGEPELHPAHRGHEISKISRGAE